MRDVTALFGLPKKVAAGTGGAAIELEQQLQKAQQLAQKEHQRAAELEMKLQVSCLVHSSTTLCCPGFTYQAAQSAGSTTSMPQHNPRRVD